MSSSFFYIIHNFTVVFTLDFTLDKVFSFWENVHGVFSEDIVKKIEIKT